MNESGNGKDALGDSPFTFYEGKGDKVFISWKGRQVTVLIGKKAKAFMLIIAPLGEAKRQMVMAKATGNFKRGNER